MSDPSMDATDNYTSWQESVSDMREENERLRKAVENAYGCLWRSLDLDAKSNHARKLLLAEIDKNGQRRGITYAQQKFGSVSNHEILMGPDLP